MLISRVQSVTPHILCQFGCKVTKRFPNVCPIPTYLTPFQSKIVFFPPRRGHFKKFEENLKVIFEYGLLGFDEFFLDTNRTSL